MIFIAPQGINCFVNDIHGAFTAHYCIIVVDPIKGAVPPAFNRTLERVALKQASRNPLLQATFKKAALYTQLSKPPFARNKHPTRPFPIKHITNALPVSQRSGTTDKQCGRSQCGRIKKSRVQFRVVNKIYFSSFNSIRFCLHNNNNQQQIYFSLFDSVFIQFPIIITTSSATTNNSKVQPINSSSQDRIKGALHLPFNRHWKGCHAQASV